MKEEAYQAKEKLQNELNVKNVMALRQAVVDVQNALQTTNAKINDLNLTISNQHEERLRMEKEFQELRTAFFTMKTQIGAHRQ